MSGMIERKGSTPLEILAAVLPEDLARDIISHRKGIKCPLTPRGASSLLREYQLTGNPVNAAEHHLNVGWRGFKAEWMNKGNRYRDEGNPMPKSGGAPVSFEQPMPDEIRKRVILPATHFTNQWKGRQ